MYADNTLTPKEVSRLCALGTLARGAMPYGELASTIRHFMDRVQGPSLDVMGTSLEFLKYEGLVQAAAPDQGEDTRLTITDSGRAELELLLTTNIRPGATDINKLIVALKFRFLHLLDGTARQAQVDALIDATEVELARLADLRGHHTGDGGYLLMRLAPEIDTLEARVNWLGTLDSKLN